jgi:hypothetical protein
MSNFDTLTPHVAGRAGTAPVGFNAATEDDLPTLTGTGYLNDLKDQVKNNDYFFVNYGDGYATLVLLKVTVLGEDYSLVAFP